MSIPTKEQADSFLAPLRGNVTVLLLHDVEAKVPISRFLLRCASLHSLQTTVLDTDAFYCANIDRLDGSVATKDGELMLLSEGDLEVGSLLPLLSSRRQLLIVDDLNSLHSLASDALRSQQLSILFKLLSHNARMNGSWVVATRYGAELTRRGGETKRRSIAALGDLLVEAEVRSGSVRLIADLKDYWPDGEYSL